MRCKACNVILTDYECSRKSLITGDYIDLCNFCFSFIQEDVVAFGNPNLVSESDEIFLQADDSSDEFERLD